MALVPREVTPYASSFQRALGAYRQARDVYRSTRSAIETVRNLTAEFEREPRYRPGTFGSGQNRMPYRTYGSAGSWSARGNRIYYRKLGSSSRRRRRLRWGTRVRREALKLGDGKRHTFKDFTSYNDAAAVPQNTVKRFVIMNNIDQVTSLASGVTLDATQQMANRQGFSGKSFKLRGIKIHMLLQNKMTTNPIDFRIICGWRKGRSLTQTNFASNTRIFKDRRDKAGYRALTETWSIAQAATWEATQAPLDPQAFHCVRDMVVRLGPNTAADADQGPGAKKIQFWWDFGNKEINFDSDYGLGDTDEIEKRMNIFPVVYVYHTNPVGTSASTGNCFFHGMMYYRDPGGNI